MTEWFRKVSTDKPVDRKRLFVLAGGAAVLVLLISSFWPAAGGSETEIAPQAQSLAPVAQPSGMTIVHVVGAVRTPGVYELPSGSRVIDAVNEAGGLGRNADPASVNMARVVQDGEQVFVSRISRATASEGAVTDPNQNGLVNINLADATALEQLPRIGPTLAERIVSYRDANGPFASIDSLLDVPGIGSLTLEGFRAQLTL